MSNKPVLLVCTPEITYLPKGMGNLAQAMRAQGGGLADISAALVAHIHDNLRDEFEMHVAIPNHKMFLDNEHAQQISQQERQTFIRSLRNNRVHLINHDAFTAPSVYEKTRTHNTVDKALAFQAGVINTLLRPGHVVPDIIHANDWMTGLIPAFARTQYGNNQSHIKSLFTFHNVYGEEIALRKISGHGISLRDHERPNGRIMLHGLHRRYLPPEYENEESPGWDDNPMHSLLTGMIASDHINTVSKTFLEEIARGDFDYVHSELSRIVHDKLSRGQAHGILNAPDPKHDSRVADLPQNYDLEDIMEGRTINREAFTKHMGLNHPHRPTFLWTNRLSDQKRPDLLIANIDRLVESGYNLAVIADGETHYEQALDRAAHKHPDNVVRRKFNPSLSDLGKASVDAVLLPSAYEPCGLPQLESLQYGTLAVVRETGGLKDTIQELSADSTTGNGFVFINQDTDEFYSALTRAANFANKSNEEKQPILQRIVQDARERFTMEETAQEYVRLYETLLRS